MRIVTSTALINAALFAAGILLIEYIFMDGNFAKAAGAAIFYASGAFSVALAMWTDFHPGDWVRDKRSGDLCHFRYRIGSLAYVTLSPQRLIVPVEQLELYEPIEMSERRERKLLADKEEGVI